MSDKIDNNAFDDGKADRLLRETMAGYKVEPKPGTWKGISRKLLWSELLHFNFSNLSPKIWLAGTAGIFLAGTLIYLAIQPESRDAIPSSQATAGGRRTSHDAASQPRATSTMVAKPARTQEYNPPAVSVENRHENDLPASNRTGTNLAQHTASTTLTATGLPHGQRMSDDQAEIIANAGAATTITPASLQGMASGISRLRMKSAVINCDPDETDTIIRISNPNGIVQYRKSHPPVSRFFSASAGIAPEMAIYTNPDNYSMANIWLNGAFTFHLSRFSISSGAGIGYVFDQGKYHADYKSNDSVGYFNEVINYTIGNNNELIFNTQSVAVYDSLMHTSNIRTTDRHTYLQVPLLLGYRFYEGRSTSLAVRLGPALSFLLASQPSDPEFTYMNARLVRMDDKTPSRVQTNWQIWADLWFEMRLNKQASLYLAPSFKYFLNPMVEQENTTYQSPWTFGLGVGLEFNFGKQK